MKRREEWDHGLRHKKQKIKTVQWSEGAWHEIGRSHKSVENSLNRKFGAQHVPDYDPWTSEGGW
jgi:hypothetical protein